MLKKRYARSLIQSLRFLATPLLVSTLLTLELPSRAHAQERAVAANSWTDSTGAKTIKADFVKLEGVNLTVRMEDGSEKVIPLSKLDDKSRLKAREMAKNAPKPSTASSTAATGEKKGTSSAKFTTPVSFPSNPTAQEFMDIVVRELKNENPMVVWDALPASKQKQAQDIVKLASTRIEQRTLTSIKKFRGDVLTALKSKKKFILNSTKLPIQADQKKTLAGSYDSLVEMVEAYIPEEWMDASYLQQTEVRDLLATYVEKLAAKGEAVKNSLPVDSPFRSMMMQTPASVKVESSGSQEAMVTFVIPGQPAAPVKYVLSEGRWLPEQMIGGWDQGLAQAKTTLEQVNPKDLHQMVGRGLIFANGILGTVSTAETQEDFDEAIGQLMGGMGAMLPMQP